MPRISCSGTRQLSTTNFLQAARMACAGDVRRGVCRPRPCYIAAAPPLKIRMCTVIIPRACMEPRAWWEARYSLPYLDDTEQNGRITRANITEYM